MSEVRKPKRRRGSTAYISCPAAHGKSVWGRRAEGKQGKGDRERRRERGKRRGKERKFRGTLGEPGPAVIAN